jgi:7-carboxy-7-deazaguanine synthase
MTQLTVVPPTAPDTRRFLVSEVFTTYQGEGTLIGIQTHFIRFAGCDSRCSWCDTKDSVDPKVYTRIAQKRTISELVAEIESLTKVEWVTLSGGNPALFELEPLVDGLHAIGYKVAVETQATIWKPWLAGVECLTVSPKPPSSGMEFDRDNFRMFIGNYCMMQEPWQLVIKIPCQDETDLQFARAIHVQYPALDMYIQPVWRRFDVRDTHLMNLRQLMQMVSTMPEMKNVVLLPQLHKLVGVR